MARLLTQLAQGLHRALGHATIIVGFVGHVAPLTLQVVRQVGGKLPSDNRLVVAMAGIVHLRWDAPRNRVALNCLAEIVKNLAYVLREVAVLLEVLRQRYDVRQIRPEMRGQVPDAQRVGSAAREQRGS